MATHAEYKPAQIYFLSFRFVLEFYLEVLEKHKITVVHRKPAYLLYDTIVGHYLWVSRCVGVCRTHCLVCKVRVLWQHCCCLRQYVRLQPETHDVPCGTLYLIIYAHLQNNAETQAIIIFSHNFFLIYIGTMI